MPGFCFVFSEGVIRHPLFLHLFFKKDCKKLGKQSGAHYLCITEAMKRKGKTKQQ